MRNWDEKNLKTTTTSKKYAQRGLEETGNSSSAPEPKVAYTVTDNGTVVNRTVIRLDGRAVNRKSGRVPVQWAVDKDSISLAWWSPAKSLTWTLSVDGKPATKTTDTSWSTQFPDSSAHTFEADGVQKLKTSDGKTQLAPFTYSVTTKPADSAAIGKQVDDPFVASKAANRDLVGLAEEADVEAGLSYRAFIPTQYVSGPLFCKVTTNTKYAYYGGDNRGFSADIYDQVNKSRVSIDRTVGFGKSGSQLYPLGRFTGDTKAYDANHKLLATKNAGPSATDIIDVNGQTSTRLTGTLTIKGANPLCTGTPSIDGKVHYDLRKTGALNFSGVHDQAPNHEVIYYYGDWVNGIAKTGRAYGRALNSFNCLAGPPVCADATFNVTVQAAEI